MTNYVRAANPIWFMVDLIGEPLNDEYYAFFLTNTLPYLPQAVYANYDPDNLIPWNNPLEFQPSGTLPDNLYFNEDLVYRIEIRHGNSQSDPLIWEINNFVPGSGSSIPENNLLNNDNQISNPQFTEINFLTPLTYTQAVSGNYIVDVAPGWQLLLTGAGTTVLTQIPISGQDSGDITNPISGNPPYALQIDNVGWSEAKLVQRFDRNGALYFAGAIGICLNVRPYIDDYFVEVLYVPSDGTSPGPVISDFAPSGIFTVLQGATDLDPSDNPDEGDDAYIDFTIILQGTGKIDITNIQLIGQSVPLADDFDVLVDVPLFKEQTVERGIDHLFHYYKPQLAGKPIPSYLVGWDFPLNPAQFLGSTVAASAIGANKSKYVWDQTILFQSANSGVGITRGGHGEIVVTAAATTQAALIQYLSSIDARKILECPASVNAAINRGTLFPARCTISLWYTKDVSLPSIRTSNNSLIATLDADGKPATFNGTWFEVPRVNNQDATFDLLPVSDNSFIDYNFSGWDLSGEADVNLATFFAIVIGSSEMASTAAFSVLSVGLCGGEIATRPAPQTPDEVLRECQYYWEQSYPAGTPAGSASNPGAKFIPAELLVDAGDYRINAPAITIQYKQTKRIAPTGSFYALNGTPTTLDVGIYQANTTVAGPNNPVLGTTWSNIISVDSYSLIPAISTSLVNITSDPSYTGRISFHYTFNARLGDY